MTSNDHLREWQEHTDSQFSTDQVDKCLGGIPAKLDHLLGLFKRIFTIEPLVRDRYVVTFSVYWLILILAVNCLIERLHDLIKISYK